MPITTSLVLPNRRTNLSIAVNIDLLANSLTSILISKARCTHLSLLLVSRMRMHSPRLCGSKVKLDCLQWQRPSGGHGSTGPVCRHVCVVLYQTVKYRQLRKTVLIMPTARVITVYVSEQIRRLTKMTIVGLQGMVNRNVLG